VCSYRWANWDEGLSSDRSEEGTRKEESGGQEGSSEEGDAEEAGARDSYGPRA
jgi:hypothetical protein